MLTVSVALLFASYLFVIQPKYDPPVADYYSRDSAEIEITDVSYLFKYEDGSYAAVLSDGQFIPVNDEYVLELMLSQDYIIKEEGE